MLAVIAAGPENRMAAAARLAALGAHRIEVRSVSQRRLLVYGRFDDGGAAWEAVGRLRAQGWAAVQRPADEDPALAAWRNRTRPLRVGDGRLLVCPPWTEGERAADSVVEIDPGAAFGGGSHPTTCLLLEALAERLRGGERVLDVGCGSGVLAIAAVRLGADRAVGIDVDPAAVAATRANAERNELERCVSALAMPLADVPGAFEVVVANIGLEVLLELAGDLVRRLTPEGWLGLSGISPAQVSRLQAAFPTVRFVERQQDDWSALIGTQGLWGILSALPAEPWYRGHAV